MGLVQRIGDAMYITARCRSLLCPNCFEDPHGPDCDIFCLRHCACTCHTDHTGGLSETPSQNQTD